MARAETYLQESHEDTMKNFDLKLLKLKKNIKVVLASEVLDGFMAEAGDE